MSRRPVRNLTTGEGIQGRVWSLLACCLEPSISLRIEPQAVVLLASALTLSYIQPQLSLFMIHLGYSPSPELGPGTQLQPCFLSHLSLRLCAFKVGSSLRSGILSLSCWEEPD